MCQYTLYLDGRAWFDGYPEHVLPSWRYMRSTHPTATSQHHKPTPQYSRKRRSLQHTRSPAYGSRQGKARETPCLNHLLDQSSAVGASAKRRNTSQAMILQYTLGEIPNYDQATDAGSSMSHPKTTFENNCKHATR